MVQPGAAAPAAVTGTIAGVNDHQPSRAQQLLRAIRKEIPEALADEQDHDDAEVAAMLRELGIALVECEQPTQLVAAPLLAIATSTRAKPSVWWCCRPRW